MQRSRIGAHLRRTLEPVHELVHKIDLVLLNRDERHFRDGLRATIEQMKLGNTPYFLPNHRMDLLMTYRHTPELEERALQLATLARDSGISQRRIQDIALAEMNRAELRSSGFIISESTEGITVRQLATAVRLDIWRDITWVNWGTPH